jgi:hypothetical protein
MLRLLTVEMIVVPDIKESKHTTVNPSSALFHQILMTFHRICFGHRVWNVPEIVLLAWLTVYAQT